VSRRRRGATTAVGLISAAALAVAGCGAPGKGGTKTIKPGDVPDKPKHPVTLNILDIAGNLGASGSSGPSSRSSSSTCSA
jgi:hypothetical protein